MIITAKPDRRKRIPYYADDDKWLTNKFEEVFVKVLYLAKNDSIDNYYEVSDEYKNSKLYGKENNR